MSTIIIMNLLVDVVSCVLAVHTYDIIIAYDFTRSFGGRAKPNKLQLEFLSYCHVRIKVSSWLCSAVKLCTFRKKECFRNFISQLIYIYITTQTINWQLKCIRCNSTAAINTTDQSSLTVIWPPARRSSRKRVLRVKSLVICWLHTSQYSSYAHTGWLFRLLHSFARPVNVPFVCCLRGGARDSRRKIITKCVHLK